MHIKPNPAQPYTHLLPNQPMALSTNQPTVIHSIKLSSVGPGRATGSDVTHNPTAMDLAMKLHYVIGLYFFKKESVEGLSVMMMKESMFYWFNDYYVTCGRFRRPDSGRPYMKCNDCGARFVEAHCDKSLEEWVRMGDFGVNNKQLVYHLPIGPEIAFSPPVYFQVTWFKCGGMSLGLSWAHILGDVASACEFLNSWGRLFSQIKAQGPPNPISNPSPRLPKPETRPITQSNTKQPLSITRVNPVGEHWVTANNFKMDTISFHLTPNQITHVKSNYNKPIPIFESICAVILKSITKIRDSDQSPITICKPNSNNRKPKELSNDQDVKTVGADFSNADFDKLADLLANGGLNERDSIADAMEKDNGVPDFVVYGANLTFVNLEEVELYGLEVNGNRAEMVWYGIQGVGDKGAVVVMKDGSEDGRLVNVTLPDEEIVKLKVELKEYGLLVDGGETYIE